MTSAGPQLTPPIRLLVVEDDPGTSDVIRTELTLAGYAVTTSDHPDGALDMVSQNRVDLVLLGLDRPRLNSLDLLARIKNAAPGHARADAGRCRRDRRGLCAGPRVGC